MFGPLSDLRKSFMYDPQVDGGAAGKGSGKSSWWPPSLSQLALMAQMAKMAGKVFGKNKKAEGAGPKIEEIFS